MKAFVIKNKEGKYIKNYAKYISETFDDIICASIYTKREIAEIYMPLSGCEVVEITIAEGDLGQENKQLKERINDLADLISKYANGALNDFAVKKLREQLAEKDEEINKLQQMAIIDMQAKEILELQVATIRKQVCNEIRKFIDNNEHSEENEAKQSSESVVYTRQLYNLLDQIEQAKESKPC